MISTTEEVIVTASTNVPTGKRALRSGNRKGRKFMLIGIAVVVFLVLRG